MDEAMSLFMGLAAAIVAGALLCLLLASALGLGSEVPALEVVDEELAEKRHLAR